MNTAERAVRRVDAFQQLHPQLAFVYGVIKKFGDDRGGSLAALLTYSAFLAMFPFSYLLTTVIGEREWPGTNPAAVGVGLFGLVWGTIGFGQTAQYAMAQVWNLPNETRPGFFPRLLRGLGFVLTVAVGFGLTTFVTSVASLAPGSVSTRLAIPLGTLLINTGIFVAAFRILTPQIASRELLPGSIVAAIGWSVLQVGGALLVGHQLRHASQVYGYFASTVGLLSFLYIGAQLIVYAAEINVVKARRLWPRSIVQPPLTPADRRALDDIAEQERRRPEQSVASVWKAS